MNRRAKYLSMLAIVVGAGLALLASTQQWFSLHLTSAAAHPAPVVVQGSAAAPALTALSLAGIALAAALAIAGPIVRIVLAVLGVVVGGCLLLSAGIALANPVVAAQTAVTSATGVSGGASVGRLVAATDVAVWPGVALAGGIVLAAASVAVIVTTRRWPGPSRRYEATRFEDAEGRGPAAAAQEASAASAAAVASSNEPGPDLERDTAIDSWDELSRGDDPTV